MAENTNEENDVKKGKVAFNKEQMDVLQQMLAEAREAGNQRSSVSPISMYNLRDPQSIETVNVKRVDGKFVLGFENFQKDIFKKKPKYLQYKAAPSRGLFQEPFITLLLSEDGKEVEKKEMLLVDYCNERDYFQAKCLEVKKKEVIEDHGFLGSNGEYATAVDEKGMPVPRQTVLAQTKREERVFVVELPGFEKPYEFISDFLA